MNEVDKATLLASFKEWTGGFEPSESAPADLEIFSQSVWAKDFQADEVLEMLIIEHLLIELANLK